MKHAVLALVLFATVPGCTTDLGGGGEIYGEPATTPTTTTITNT